MNQFSKLKLNDWRQFESVDLDFAKQTTILTGSNGCGKTTILTVLSRHFGWNVNFVSTPYWSKTKAKKFFSDLKRYILGEPKEGNGQVEVGTLDYLDGNTCKLFSPRGRQDNPQYQLSYQNQQQVEGLLIPSHRPVVSYQAVSQIPTNPKTIQQHHQEYQSFLQQTYGSDHVQNPGKILKQSLISLATFGFGNEAVRSNEEYRDIFLKFQEVLKIVLPLEIGFIKIEIRMPEVVLVTESGDFSLDAMSGGISSIFGIAWQILMFSHSREDCTVIIDEPENHLHPKMQRTLLPDLERAFPNCKFIIATHSPFIVTSNPKASVFGLVHNEKSKVISRKLTHADMSATPDKVLRDILDVPTTIPVWVEQEISRILAKHSDSEDDPRKVELIFNELKQLGLNESLFGYSSKGRDP